jgi:hypothetical protein
MITTQQASKQPHEESHGFFLLQNASMYMIWSIMISIGIVSSQKKRASSSWLRPTDTLMLACVGFKLLPLSDVLDDKQQAAGHPKHRKFGVQAKQEEHLLRSIIHSSASSSLSSSLWNLINLN